MILAIVAMFIIAAAVMLVFILLNPQALPVMVGQRWHMPGVGVITIIRVLGSGITFEEAGSNLDVMYQLVGGGYGFCRKGDIRNFGKLFPHSHKVHNISSKKEQEIEKILEEMRRRKEEFVAYDFSSPGIQDAEIIPDPVVKSAIKQYRYVMLHSDDHND